MTATGIGTCHANLNHATRQDECREITVPALLLYGENTLPCHRRMAEIVAECIPDSRLLAIPDAGHLSPITHPEPVAKAIRDQVERHTG
jgi:pimeloyl-ACP methyl ester carboxylesterase